MQRVQAVAHTLEHRRGSNMKFSQEVMDFIHEVIAKALIREMKKEAS